jgi:Na+-driven multidrug efflux pump
MVWVLCIPIALAYFFGGGKLVSVFMEHTDGSAMEEGRVFLRIVSPFYFMIAIKLVSDGVLRGSGMMKPFMIGTFTDMFLRVVLVYILSSILGSVGIWLAWPGSWLMGTIISVWYYRCGIWKDALEE